MRKFSPILPASECSSNNTLYVVLHGLVCLVDEGPGHGFIAYLNDMGSEHKYLCGDFLVEQEIPVSSDGYTKYLELVNVSNDKPSDDNMLDPKANTIVKLPFLPSATSKDIRVAIGLPRPKKIRPYIIGKIASGAFQGDTSILVDVPETIAGIRIFEYSFNDFHKVRLQDGPHNIIWECPPPIDIKYKKHEVSREHIAVLHIYNEPLEEMPHPHAADHNLREFNRTLSYLGTKLELKIPGSVIDSEADDSCQVEPKDAETSNSTAGKNKLSPLHGVFGEEVAALDDRHDFVVGLTAILRELYNYRHDIKQLEEALQEKSALSNSKKDLEISKELAKLIVYLFGQIRLRGAGGGGAGGSQVCGGANGLITG